MIYDQIIVGTIEDNDRRGVKTTRNLNRLAYRLKVEGLFRDNERLMRDHVVRFTARQRGELWLVDKRIGTGART